MRSIEEQKRELLLESDINRQVLQLESEQLRIRLDQLRHGVLDNRWKMLLPVAGIFLAWRFRRFGGFLKSSVGLILLRKIWDAFVSHR